MGLAGSTAASRWKIVWFTEYGMPPRASCLGGRGIGEHAQGLRRVGGDHDGVKGFGHGLGAPRAEVTSTPSACRCTAVTGLESRMSGRVPATLST